MDINNSLPYEKLQELYKKYFSLSYLGNDINNKFALISLVCYLTYKLKAKNPDITHWTVLYNINNKGVSRVPEDVLKGLAVICSDLGSVNSSKLLYSEVLISSKYSLPFHS